MSNPQQAQAVQLLPLDKLVRPNHLANLGFLSSEAKEQYSKGILGLWKKIQENPATDNPERVAAHRRLSEISSSLRAQMLRWRNDTSGQGQQQTQAQQQTQNQGLNATEAQQIQQQEGGQQAVQPTAQPQYSERVKSVARDLKVKIPQQFQGRSVEDQQRYINAEKRKYADALQKYEVANRRLEHYRTQVSERRKQQEFSAEEQEKIRNHVATLVASVNETRGRSLAIKQQHEGIPDQAQQAQQNQLSQQQQQQQQQQARPAAGASTQIKQEGTQRPPMPKQEPTEIKSDATSRPSTAVAQSQSTIAPTQQPPSQPASATIQTPTQTQSLSKPPTPLTATKNTQGTPGTGASSSAPQPLSHQMALDAAANFQKTQQTQQPQPLPQQQQQQPQQPQQPSHGHPAQGSQPQAVQRENSSAPSAPPTRPHNRPLNVQPLQPVNIGPSRPTLPGGQGTIGAMGQPGIQKPPAFSLEGDMDRVLSKKKLDDLVRQVTGGSGGEGAESLDPDVEETLLDVADEFVDNVIMQACRLAKLRQSAQLELRDIQLILERNYNIRVPGFASDELRTVRKIQPTQAWTQKMSAVQAAKVTGGKADI